MQKQERSDRYWNRPSLSVNIPRAILQDEALSSEARFLYCLLRSFEGWRQRDGRPWRLDDLDLMRRSGWRRRETLYRYRGELVAVGLVTRIQLVDERGCFAGVDWEVLPDYPDEVPPSDPDGLREDRTPEKPDSGKTGLRENRTPEKPDYGKTGVHKQGLDQYPDIYKTPHTPHRGATRPGETDPFPNQEPEGGPDLDEQSVIEDDQDLNRDSLNGDGSAPPKQESSERGLKGSARPVSTSSGRTAYPEAFEAVWKAYRKGSGSKLSAFRAWDKVVKAFPDLDVLAAVEGFVRRKEAEDAEECRRRGGDPRDRRRFWKDLSSWLNNRCWEDEPVATAVAQPGERMPDCHRHQPVSLDDHHRNFYWGWKLASPWARERQERDNDIPGAVEYCHERWAEEPPEVHERYRQQHEVPVEEGV